MSVCAIGCQQLFFLVCSMTRAVERLNERELQQGAGKSWHDDYKDSAYIFIGNLDYMLTEGDVLTVFSQCVFLVPPPLFSSSPSPLQVLCSVHTDSFSLSLQVRGTNRHQLGPRQGMLSMQICYLYLHGPAHSYACLTLQSCLPLSCVLSGHWQKQRVLLSWVRGSAKHNSCS